jgi:hypothetical protein
VTVWGPPRKVSSRATARLAARLTLVIGRGWIGNEQRCSVYR